MSNPEIPSGPSKKGVALSVLFHVLIALVLFFVAAREGAMGEKFKKIAVVIVPKKKEVEKPKEEKKPELPKVEEAKKETPKPKTAPIQEAMAKPVEHAKAPPVLIDQAAPAAVIASDFAFGGSSTVATTTDPVEAYQGLVQYELETCWSYPKDLKQMGLITEVEVTVDSKGGVTFKGWKQKSQNKEWDDSVEKVFQKPRTLRRQPPTGFPSLVVVRFDMINRDLILN